MKYDPDVINEVARRLYQAATNTEIACILVGGLAGFAFGYTVDQGTCIGRWFFTLLGLAVGFLYGDAWALRIRFDAQAALCQSEIEKSVRHLRPATAREDRTSGTARVADAGAEDGPVCPPVATTVRCRECRKKLFIPQGVVAPIEECPHCGCCNPAG